MYDNNGGPGMKKYTIWETNKEIGELEEIKHGCTLDDPMPILCGKFDDLNDAREVLNGHSTIIKIQRGAAGVYYKVKEFWISEEEGGVTIANICAITPMMDFKLFSQGKVVA